MDPLIRKLPVFVLTLVVGLMAMSTAFGAATIVIQSADGPNTGFNDLTPAMPVGENSGTTVGQQRLIAFQFAANIWGATLTSGPKIIVRASWASLSCTATSAILGAAGNSDTIWRDFPGAVPGTWYGNALANALSNKDRNGSDPEIVAQFNSELGKVGCLESSHWYYGLDTNTDAGGINLVTVLLHEFGHGLGFQSFTNASSGTLNSGFPSIFDRFLFDKNTNKTWPEMTNAERASSAIGTNSLVWNGPQVMSVVPSVLALGNPQLRVNSPPGIAGAYQVGTADFGPKLTSAGVTAAVVQASDPAESGGGTGTDACSPLTNGGAVSGKIALIDRGTCAFVVKVKNAQNAGAVGVIISDNVAGSPAPGMGGSDPTITIPAVRVILADGNTIKSQLASGVNATLRIDESVRAGTDISGRPRLYTPNPFQGGSSVSHWDTSAFPNQLMEPNLSSDLNHSVTPPQDLTFSLLKDIGWCAACPQPSPSPMPPPANDNFLDAQVIGGVLGSVTGTNVGATKESGEPNHGGGLGSVSIWYRWQAPTSGTATLATNGSNIDTLLAVYTGSTLNSLTQIASNDDFDNTLQSAVTFNAQNGMIYYVAIDGFGGATGSVTLKWRLPPPNNDFANAQTISGCQGSINGTNLAADKEADEPNHSGPGGASVWYQWQAPSDSSVIMSTTGSDYDTTLAVYTGNSIGTLATIAKNDDDEGKSASTSSVVFNAIAGTVYKIAVDGSFGRMGHIVLNWTCGGSCVVIPVVVGSVMEGTLATTDCRSLLRGFDPTYADRYTFHGTAGQQISFLLTSTAFDSYLYLVKPDSTVAAADDDGGGNNDSRIPAGSGFFSLPVSGIYTIEATSHLNSKTGPYSLTIAAASNIQFSAASYTAGEGDGSANITVTRTGNAATKTSVDFATSDATAHQRSDYTPAAGTLSFAAGETSKTFAVLITDNVYVDGNRTVNLTLSNATGGATLGVLSTTVLTITDNDTAPPITNPLDNLDGLFFVRQHYYDFLNRQPDIAGLNFWTNEMTSCGANAHCLDIKRPNVSAAFYLSIEFQQTGYLVERIYKASYGNGSGMSTLGGLHQLAVPIVGFSEFLPDTQTIGRGVVVNQAGWEQMLENNKQVFTSAFVQRSRFTNAFSLTMTPAQFVDKLNQNAGNVLSSSERTAAINLFGGAAGTANTTARAQALRQVAEAQNLYNAEFNRAFVLMQFFGYLRRDPNSGQDIDYTGYDFWLTKLNAFSGDFANAEMVKAFITSGEYRQRFGP